MKFKFKFIVIILMFALLFMCCSEKSNPTSGGGGSSSSSKHANCSHHSTHWHYSAINHTHTSTYSTPCQDSHGHCH